MVQFGVLRWLKLAEVMLRDAGLVLLDVDSPAAKGSDGGGFAPTITTTCMELCCLTTSWAGLLSSCLPKCPLWVRADSNTYPHIQIEMYTSLEQTVVRSLLQRNVNVCVLSLVFYFSHCNVNRMLHCRAWLWRRGVLQHQQVETKHVQVQIWIIFKLILIPWNLCMHWTSL